MSEKPADLAWYAWVTELPDGSWSTIGVGTALSAQTCLINRDRALMEEFRGVAERHGRENRQRVCFVEMRVAAVLEAGP